MELFVSLIGGYKVECVGCLAKIKLGDAKVIVGKCYCPTCYPIVKNNNTETKETTEI